MKCFLLLIITLITSSAWGQKTQNKSVTSKSELVSYSWKYKDFALFGTIQVPKDFTESTHNYREGIITRLTYSDGSLIILHRGGMMKIPFFDGTDYIVSEKCEKWSNVERGNKIIHQVFRRGVAKDKDLFWREENTYFSGFPVSLNIAYEKVPKEQVELFNQALDSYIGIDPKLK